MKDKKSVFWGVIIILLAVYVIVSKMMALPDIPVIKIAFTILLAYIIFSGIRKLHFGEIFIPLAIIAWMFDKALGIENLTPWPVLIAAVLLSIGFGMIFKKRRFVVKSGRDISMAAFDNVDINEADGSTITVKNTFGELSKYVNSNDFTAGEIKNTFGETRVYFNNAVMADGKSTLYIDNTFGDVCVYLPNTWRMELKRNNSFGDILVKGTGNNDMDAPFIKIEANNTFGDISIMFE